MEPKDETIPKESPDEKPDFSQYSKEYRVLGSGTYWSEYEQARFEHAVASINPEVQKAILEEGPLFARWSPDIELDKAPEKSSQTVAARTLGLKPIKEPGISVDVIDNKSPNLGLNLRYSMAGRFGYRERKLYIIKGKPISAGFDFEPLLEPTSIEVVTTVPYVSKILDDFPDLKYHNPYT